MDLYLVVGGMKGPIRRSVPPFTTPCGVRRRVTKDLKGNGLKAAVQVTVEGKKHSGPIPPGSIVQVCFGSLQQH